MSRVETMLRRFIGVRPWVALFSFLFGVAITIPAFYLHNLWLALAGAPFLAGGLLILLIPLPYSQ
jgi:hypothetical protein